MYKCVCIYVHKILGKKVKVYNTTYNLIKALDKNSCNSAQTH